jgi:hypothetical protein
MFGHQNLGSGSGSGFGFELTENAGSGSVLKPMRIRNTACKKGRQFQVQKNIELLYEFLDFCFYCF